MKVKITLGPVLHEGLRYEDEEVYDVDPDIGGYFRGMGWAEAAPEDAKIPRGHKPFDTAEATDEDAEEWDAKAEERFQRAQRKLAGGTEPDLDVHDAESGSGTGF